MRKKGCVNEGFSCGLILGKVVNANLLSILNGGIKKTRAKAGASLQTLSSLIE